MKPAILVALLVFFELFALCIAEPRMTSPFEFLGYGIGTQLTPWNKEIEYFRTLDRASDLIKVETFGNSTEGREMILATLFDGDAQKNLEQVKKLNEPINDSEARTIANDAKPIVFLSCDIHSSEYEDTESIMEFAYELLTTYNDKLKDVMVVINPSINPDGHDIYRQWYSEYKGTKYAGTQPPNYHAYVGHDLNRDWHEGNTVEMRNMWSAFLRYSPQVFIDNHMMGSRGYRMYIAPE
jgi:murein tripeptide amidase MpaA